jgi:hypothetical protein
VKRQQVRSAASCSNSQQSDLMVLFSWWDSEASRRGQVKARSGRRVTSFENALPLPASRRCAICVRHTWIVRPNAVPIRCPYGATYATAKSPDDAFVSNVCVVCVVAYVLLLDVLVLSFSPSASVDSTSHIYSG